MGWNPELYTSQSSRGKVNYVESEACEKPKRSFTGTGADIVEKTSLVTLPIGLGVGVFGIATANPVLAGAGFGSAGIDTVEIAGARHVKKKEREKREREAAERALAGDKEAQKKLRYGSHMTVKDGKVFENLRSYDKMTVRKGPFTLKENVPVTLSRG